MSTPATFPHVMKSLSSRRLAASLEPLEARIAPAQIFIGAPDGVPGIDTIKDLEYREGLTSTQPPPDYPDRFVDTSLLADPISQAVHGAGVNNTFFLRLTKGDQVFGFTQATSYQEIINVKSGNVIAFFVDYNGNNNYDQGELTGLSLGKDAQVTISTNVRGDIVTNLNENGTKTTADDTLDLAGLVSPKQGIKQLNIQGGSVFGKVLSGGAIKKIQIAGNVDMVLAGSAVNNTDANTNANFPVRDGFADGLPDGFTAYDFFPARDINNNGVLDDAFEAQPGGGGQAVFTPAPGLAGVSITNVLIKSVTDRIEAGSGGAGAKGGSLKSIQITEDTDGFRLQAGRGGAATGGPSGGAGGSIVKVYVGGFPDETPNNAGVGGLPVAIVAGAGGDGPAAGQGGKGGLVKDVNVGFELNQGKVNPSSFLLSDSVLVAAGAGGAGRVGGAGGKIAGVNIRLSTPDAVGDEIRVIGGAGGAALDANVGKAGTGGSLQKIIVSNQSLSGHSDTLIQAGDGGVNSGQARGGKGGAVANVKFLGFDLRLLGGNGSDGGVGGAGGSIKNLLSQDTTEIGARDVIIGAGRGGNGLDGNGGNAGNVQLLRAVNSDVVSFLINPGTMGAGGNSIGGKGGRGSAVKDIKWGDTDLPNPIGTPDVLGIIDLRGGRGGDGEKGGGVGGALAQIEIGAIKAGFIGLGGQGGNATQQGRGGAGGGLVNVQFTGEDISFIDDVSARMAAGAGGNGAGNKGAGGKGGSLKLVNANVDGSVDLTAGNGGNGDAAGNGAPGSGGSIFLTGGFARNGDGTMRAGDAGAQGAGPANGGSILGNAGGASQTVAGLRAAQNLSLIAGHGTHGGRGGDIKDVAYGSTADSLTPTPGGNILLQAGNGSGEGIFAGKGGSIEGIFGAVSSGAGTKTRLVAGQGGGSTGKSAPGGSISNVQLALGGGPNVELTLQAGDAGDTSNGSQGAKGGSVVNFSAISLDPGTIFRSVVAGDGGNAGGTGGRGGDIRKVAVQEQDIGVRTGEVFGLTTMGGLFAGAGGTGAQVGQAGVVSQVVAESISAIVAGRGAFPQLASKVEKIYLSGNSLLLSREGAFVRNSPFTLSYDPDDAGPLPAEVTDVLSGNATKEQVAGALNALPSIAAAGGVTVTYGPLVGLNPSYRVQWIATGAQMLLTGEEVLVAPVEAVVEGDQFPIIITETVSGEVALDITETSTGQQNLSVTEIVPGARALQAGELVAGDPLGGAKEVQQLNLSYLQGFPKGQVVLTFGANTTVRIPGTDSALSATTISAAQVQAALLALPLIAAQNDPTTPEPAVVVTQEAPLIFNIAFDNTVNQPLIGGTFLVAETQRLVLGGLAQDFPTGQFTLQFGANTTTPLPSNATAAQIEAALNALPSIQQTTNTPGDTTDGPSFPRTGTVKVVARNAVTFDITFDSSLLDTQPQDRNNGDRALIVANAFVPETQTLDLSPVRPYATSEFTLSFNGDTTPLLPGNSTAAAIQTALNALPAIQATGPGNTGAVTVTAGPNDTFLIAFNTLGNQPLITGDGFRPETQQLDLSALLNIASAEFSLSYDGESIMNPARLPGSVSEAALEAAINALLTIQATGPGGTGAVDVKTTSVPGLFDITFNTNGDKLLFDGENFIHEVQVLDIYSVGSFVATFGTDSTPRLAPNTSAQDLEDALNLLTSVAAAGGVDVEAGPNSSYRIIFRADGDQELFVGTQFEAVDVSRLVAGSATTREAQLVSYLSKAAYDPVYYARANVVGAISDLNEVDSSTFRWIEVNGTPGFNLGDTPIDGLVMASVFDQRTVNFTPEAKLTARGFFDHDSVI